MTLFILKVFTSNYCRISFILSAALMYLLIPKKIFYGMYSIIGISFIIIASLVLTCLIREIKERAGLAKKYKSSGIAVIAAVIGLAALQACTIGAPVCGASIGFGFLTIFLPGLSVNLLNKYSIMIIIISLIFQVAALYFMNCFKETRG